MNFVVVKNKYLKFYNNSLLFIKCLFNVNDVIHVLPLVIADKYSG